MGILNDLVSKVNQSSIDKLTSVNDVLHFHPKLVISIGYNYETNQIYMDKEMTAQSRINVSRSGRSYCISFDYKNGEDYVKDIHKYGSVGTMMEKRFVKHHINFLNLDDKTLLLNKNVHRFPKIVAPTEKVNLLKEKYKFKITRNIHKADYSIIGDHTCENVLIYNSRYNRKNCYVKDLYEYFLNEGNNVDIELLNEVKSIYDASGNIPIVIIRNSGNLYSHRYSVNKYNKKLYFLNDVKSISMLEVKNLDFLLSINKKTFINDNSLMKKASDDLAILNRSHFETINEIIKANNKEDWGFALEILANSNFEKSFPIIAYFMFFYSDAFKVCKNWNTVNIKTLRKYFSTYIMGMGTPTTRYLRRFVSRLHNDGKASPWIIDMVKKKIIEDVLCEINNNNSINDNTAGLFKLNIKFDDDAIKLEDYYFLSIFLKDSNIKICKTNNVEDLSNYEIYNIKTKEILYSGNQNECFRYLVENDL